MLQTKLVGLSHSCLGYANAHIAETSVVEKTKQKPLTQPKLKSVPDTGSTTTLTARIPKPNMSLSDTKRQSRHLNIWWLNKQGPF